MAFFFFFKKPFQLQQSKVGLYAAQPCISSYWHYTGMLQNPVRVHVRTHWWTFCFVLDELTKVRIFFSFTALCALIGEILHHIMCFRAWWNLINLINEGKSSRDKTNKIQQRVLESLLQQDKCMFRADLFPGFPPKSAVIAGFLQFATLHQNSLLVLMGG